MSMGHTIAGRFRLLKVLGRGATSTIWLAEEALEAGGARLVALKRSQISRSDLGETVPEFQLAQRRRHPSLVEHYEMLGDECGRGIFVLEYVPCRTLAEVLQRARKLDRPIPVSFAAWIAAQLCGALELFEDPHRNISTSHVLLSFGGVPKLSGLFRVPLDSDYIGPADRGGFTFLSPEQARGDRTDIRTDIFSLGVILWELATGEKCFAAANDLETLDRILHRAARPPSELNPRVSAELDAVILRATAKAPGDRFQSPEEFREALEKMAAPAPNYVAELFAAEVEEEKQLLARSTAPERSALEAKIAAAPSSPEPYLVLADWLQHKNDPRGELIVLDHALRDLGQVTGFTPWNLRRDLNGAQLDEHQRALVAREAELLKKHGEYLLEGVKNEGNALRNLVWKLGFIGAAVISTEYWDDARETIASLAVAPSGRFLQIFRIADRFDRKNYSELGVWRFECLRSVTRGSPNISLPFSL